MDVRVLGREGLDWDAFVRSVDQGSPFHLTAWKRAIESTFGHRAHYLMAVRGGGVEGVLPLFEVRGLLGGRGLISMPYAVYGGICASSAGARTALLEAVRELAGRKRVDYVELRHRASQEMDLPTKTLYVSFSRGLSPDHEENLNARPRKQRRMIRQGAKHGLRAETELRHLEAFWDIYAHSVHCLGSPVFPRKLFWRIAQEFGKECELLTVWKEERMVAGVLSLRYEDQILPYYAGALHDALPLAVNDFMYWELMRQAVEMGCRIFDFGRSREGTGAYHFKRHWGFEPVPLPYQYILSEGRPIPNVSPANPRMRLAVDLWKKVPLPITKIIGPKVTKYLP